MNALPDLYTYQDPEALTPPEPPCDWCGSEPCAPDCRPLVTGVSMARSRERVENGDPDS